MQDARFITEGGLYRLIFSSKLPAAQDFESWVVDEVLPTIRRHGVYAIDELLDDDEFLEQAIIQLRSERAKRLAAEQALLEASPKVSYYDVVLQSDSLLTITEIAKDYGLSAKKLNSLLHGAGVQFRQSGRWFLYARFAEQGYTQSKTHESELGERIEETITLMNQLVTIAAATAHDPDDYDRRYHQLEDRHHQLETEHQHITDQIDDLRHRRTQAIKVRDYLATKPPLEYSDQTWSILVDHATVTDDGAIEIHFKA